MEAVRGWSEDEMDYVVETPPSEEVPSRKRRHEDDPEEKVSRVRLRSWQPALQTNKRAREEEPYRRITRPKVDHGIFGQKRTREYEVDTRKRPRISLEPVSGSDSFAEMNMRLTFARRIEVMILHLQGCIDAKEAGRLNEQRVARIHQIADDVRWLQEHQAISPEKLAELANLLDLLH